jgi:hypothetical protein
MNAFPAWFLAALGEQLTPCLNLLLESRLSGARGLPAGGERSEFHRSVTLLAPILHLAGDLVFDLVVELPTSGVQPLPVARPTARPELCFFIQIDLPALSG